MTNPQKVDDAFFDHFSKADKPTKLGVRLVKMMSRKIFGFAGAGSGSSVFRSVRSQSICGSFIPRQRTAATGLMPTRSLALALPAVSVLPVASSDSNGDT